MQHELNVEKNTGRPVRIGNGTGQRAQSKGAKDHKTAARTKAAKVQSNAIAALEAQVQVFVTQMSQHKDKPSKGGDGNNRRQSSQQQKTPS